MYEVDSPSEMEKLIELMDFFMIRYMYDLFFKTGVLVQLETVTELTLSGSVKQINDYTLASC